MNPIDSLIAWISPEAGLRRRHARSVLAYYEAARPNRTNKNRRDTGSGNQSVLMGGVSLRQQARHLEQNYDLADGVFNMLVANIIGPYGIGIEPQPRRADGSIDADLAKQIRELHKDWSKRPEVTWQNDWPATQRMICRAWLRDGEIFAQSILGRSPVIQHGTQVPLSLELLEAEMVPIDKSSTEPRIIQGIEINTWGRPVAYHVHLEDPSDIISYRSSLSTKRIAADRMLHIALRKRVRQLRGVSVFDNVLNRFDDLKDYEESERIAAKIAASMAGYIKKGTPDLYEPDADGDPRGLQFRPGMIFDDLKPGEDIGTIDTNRPNPQLEAYRSGQLKAIASGTGATFSSISKTYDGTYSAQRQELVEGWSSYAILGSEFISRIVQPVYEQFIFAAKASGLLKIPAGIVESSLNDALYISPQMPWIDPKKEAEAWAVMEDRHYISGPEIIRKRGGNPVDVLDQQQRWIEEQKARDLPGADGLTPSEREEQKRIEQEQRDREQEMDNERRDDEREIADAQVQRIRAQALSDAALASLRQAERDLAMTKEELASAEFRKVQAEAEAIAANNALTDLKHRQQETHGALIDELARAEHDLKMEAIQEQMIQAERLAEQKEEAWIKAEEHAESLRMVELQKRTAERDAALADYKATQAALDELSHGAGD